MYTILIPLWRDPVFAATKPFLTVAGTVLLAGILRNLPVRHARILIAGQEEHALQLRHFYQQAKGPWESLYYYFLPPETDEFSAVAHTAKRLIAEHGCGLEAPLLISGIDQWLDWSPQHFVEYCARSGADGIIPTFRGEKSPCSYVTVRPDGIITEVAGRRPISSEATCGPYWFAKAMHAYRAIDRLVAKETTRDNYLAAIYNEMIEDGAHVLPYPIAYRWPLDTSSEMQTMAHDPHFIKMESLLAETVADAHG